MTYDTPSPADTIEHAAEELGYSHAYQLGLCLDFIEAICEEEQFAEWIQEKIERTRRRRAADARETTPAAVYAEQEEHAWDRHCLTAGLTPAEIAHNRALRDALRADAAFNAALATQDRATIGAALEANRAHHTDHLRAIALETLNDAAASGAYIGRNQIDTPRN